MKIPKIPPVDATKISRNFTRDHREKASILFGNECFYIGTSWLKNSTLQLSSHPDFQRGLPEIAIAGPSNVGKSSLINALLCGHDIVRTSRKPGHTKSINFFNVSDKLLLVDMPGYGRKSESEWGDMVLQYIETRKQLRRLYLLRDCRKKFTPQDLDIMKILQDFGVSYQLVLTKSDLFPSELNAFREKIRKDMLDLINEKFHSCVPHVMFCSARNFESIEDLQCEIMAACGLIKMN